LAAIPHVDISALRNVSHTHIYALTSFSKLDLEICSSVESSGVRRKFSCGGVSFSGIWWTFVFDVHCWWRHNL